MGKISFLVAISLLVLALVPVWGSTWYVDGSVSASGDGTTWATAFKKIQEGIDAASDGDTVIIALGTYVENIQFKGKNVALTSTDPLDPGVVACTIIDGNQAGSVVTFSGTEDETCVLSGFTIQHGKAGSGGGISGGQTLTETHATIKNNVVSENSAVLPAGGTGGGLCWCAGLIENNMISRNTAELDGGGLYSCRGTIERNTIEGNSGYEGGGLFLCDGSIRNNVIKGNSATYETGGGGGVCNCRGVIEHNLVTENSAVMGGAFRWCQGAIIQNNTVAGNHARERGGGFSECPATIRSCIIWGNTAPDDPQLHESYTPTHSCIQDWSLGGIGNIAGDPLFVDAALGDYRLGAASPCVDTGADFYLLLWPQRDMDGNCRRAGGGIDMGCYEHGSLTDSDGDLLPDQADAEWLTDPLVEDSDGDGLRDGLEVLRGSDPGVPTRPTVVNVPGDTPTIQQALCLALPGEEIVVAPGTYRENVLFCGHDVTLCGANQYGSIAAGPTILDGGDVAPTVTFSGFESEACTFSGFVVCNGKGYTGGGIAGRALFPSKTRAAIRTIVVAGNSGFSGGGVTLCYGQIVNCTITGNSAHEDGSGLSYCKQATIQNCIIWGNTSVYGGQIENSSTPSFSCIQDWSGGGDGNIALDPQFVDPDGADNNPRTYGDNVYRLAKSPCIDAGDNSALNPRGLDMDGNLRIALGRKSLTVDMGAYEYGSTTFRIVEVKRTAMSEVGTRVVWNSQPNDMYATWSCFDLSTGGWVGEASVASQGASTSWTDVSAAGQQKFYRIEMK